MKQLLGWKMGDKNSSTSVLTVIFIGHFSLSVCACCVKTRCYSCSTPKPEWTSPRNQCRNINCERGRGRGRGRGSTLHCLLNPSSATVTAVTEIHPRGGFFLPLTFPVILFVSPSLTDQQISITSYPNTGSLRPLSASWWSFISFNYRWVCSFKPTNVFHGNPNM